MIMSLVSRLLKEADYDKFMAGNMTLQELKEYEALTLDEPASIPPIRLKKAVSDKKWRRLFQFHPYGRRNAGSAFDLSTLQNALPATGVNTIPLGGQTISSQIVSAGTNNVGPVRRQRKSHHESLPIRSRHR